MSECRNWFIIPVTHKEWDFNDDFKHIISDNLKVEFDIYWFDKDREMFKHTVVFEISNFVGDTVYIFQEMFFRWETKIKISDLKMEVQSTMKPCMDMEKAKHLIR